MADLIQTRRDIAVNWTSVNPILAIGEMALETDTQKFKFGDGVTAWTSLPYSQGDAGLVASDIDTLAELNAIVTDATLIDVGDLPTSTVDFDPVGTDNSDNNAVNTLYSGLATSKQDTLVSATNIKTINGTTILGSGDLVVSGGATGSDVAYDVITWDANTDVPTKNVISDLYENKTFKVDTDGALVPIVPIYWQGTQAEFTTKFGATAPTNYFTVVSDANPPAIEGIDIASTGEVGGTKYLREDGDGTSSWQTIAGGGDVTKVGTAFENQVAIWKTDGSIEGLGGLTFDDVTTNVLNVGLGADNQGNIKIGGNAMISTTDTNVSSLFNGSLIKTGTALAFTGNITSAGTINGATITSGTLNGSVTGTNTGDQVLTGLDYEPTKGADDNYVTDAEKVVIGNTSGTNTGDETTATIQTKRPLKTVNGSSLEGTGDVVVTGGVAGESAYDIAVTGGFVGTEAEWLTSLVGADGSAGAQGVSGNGARTAMVVNEGLIINMADGTWESVFGGCKLIVNGSIKQCARVLTTAQTFDWNAIFYYDSVTNQIAYGTQSNLGTATNYLICYWSNTENEWRGNEGRIIVTKSEANTPFNIQRTAYLSLDSPLKKGTIDYTNKLIKLFSFSVNLMFDDDTEDYVVITDQTIDFSGIGISRHVILVFNRTTSTFMIGDSYDNFANTTNDLYFITSFLKETSNEEIILTLNEQAFLVENLSTRNPQPKRWVALGDSHTFGSSWVGNMKHRFNGSDYSDNDTFFNTINLGLSGSHLANNGSSSFYQRFVTADVLGVGGVAEGSDVMTIFGGHNDTGLVGTIETSGFDNTTIIGSCQAIIEYAYSVNPLISIVLIVPHKRYDGTGGDVLADVAKNQAIRDVADYYGLPYLDLPKLMGINSLTQATILIDELHLDVKGRDKLENLVYDMIKKTF